MARLAAGWNRMRPGQVKLRELTTGGRPGSPRHAGRAAVHAQPSDHSSVPRAGHPARRNPGPGRPQRGQPGQRPCRTAGRPSVGPSKEPDPRAGSGAAASRWRFLAVRVCGALRDNGLRTEELRALRWNEVDLDAGTVAPYRAVRATADTKRPKSRRSRRCRDWLYGRCVSISTVRPGTGCWLACPPPADGERPVDMAGVFLEGHQDLAGRS